MGLGDEIMASGMACGAYERGKRVAFGDGRNIIWSQHAPMIFQGNPNVAKPKTEGQKNLEWVHHYSGHRLYNRIAPDRKHWIWNYDFKAKRGEIFFSEQERSIAKCLPTGFVLIEPNVPMFKSVAPNKTWHGYQDVADQLMKRGMKVLQFDYGRPKLQRVNSYRTVSFRIALACLSRASLYVGPEGGLHHAAAALGIPAVVLFGGFIPPQVTGYDDHVNLTGGAEACGSMYPCGHCAAAMKAIKTDEVVEACLQRAMTSELI